MDGAQKGYKSVKEAKQGPTQPLWHDAVINNLSVSQNQEKGEMLLLLFFFRALQILDLTLLPSGAIRKHRAGVALSPKGREQMLEVSKEPCPMLRMQGIFQSPSNFVLV